MTVYLLKDKLLRETPKYIEQQTLHDMFKRIAMEQIEEPADDHSNSSSAIQLLFGGKVMIKIRRN